MWAELSNNLMLDQELESAIRARAAQVPVTRTLKFDFQEFKAGYCRVRVPRNMNYDGIYESFHGGLLMTVADTMACFAIMTLIGTEDVLTTTDMNIRFLAPCLTDVVAHARVIKAGRSLCPVAIDLFDESGRQVALAQVTYMRLPKMPSR